MEHILIAKNCFSDAREQVRLIKHRELRQAVTAGDERTVRVLLEALGSERQIIVNMAPAGANTLLFLYVLSIVFWFYFDILFKYFVFILEPLSLVTKV